MTLLWIDPQAVDEIGMNMDTYTDTLQCASIKSEIKNWQKRRHQKLKINETNKLEENPFFSLCSLILFATGWISDE